MTCSCLFMLLKQGMIFSGFFSSICRKVLAVWFFQVVVTASVLIRIVAGKIPCVFPRPFKGESFRPPVVILNWRFFLGIFSRRAQSLVPPDNGATNQVKSPLFGIDLDGVETLRPKECLLHIATWYAPPIQWLTWAIVTIVISRSKYIYIFI